jgi:hypothetical protein
MDKFSELASPRSRHSFFHGDVYCRGDAPAEIKITRDFVAE